MTDATTADDAPGSAHARPHPNSRDTLVDHARSLDCIHCGLCLTTCPTYQLTGSETSSPRGRIHLMRAVAEGRTEADAAFEEEMNFCLVCRHCESVCPAGVEFGAMMEYTRGALRETRPPGPLSRLARWVGFGGILPRRSGLKLSALGLRATQLLRLDRIAAPFLGLRGEVLRNLPSVPGGRDRRRLDPVVPAKGELRGTVLVLEGCVMPELFGRVNHAVARTLSATGLEVRSVPKHQCCGALHAHNGEIDGAEDLARKTIEMFDEIDPSARVVVDSAGCGAHMKEYDRLLANDPAWRARAASFAERVVDYTEEIARPEALRRLDAQMEDAHGIDGPVTWDDPCHLCHGQGVTAEPRNLLDRVPNLERVDMRGADSCCGSAGIYSILRPRDSMDVLDPKLDALEESGARTLVTANPGCHMQWQIGIGRRGSGVEVLHVAEVMDRALSPPSRRGS
ncbi:MAG: heterodisulfide reductase-related iron-sulfur binding cluster [Planctomycetota bacterium]